VILVAPGSAPTISGQVPVIAVAAIVLTLIVMPVDS
jgi:hypothetical protein